MKIDINRDAEPYAFAPSHKQDQAWIVVADSKSARVFARNGQNNLALVNVLRHAPPVETELSNSTVGRGGAYGAGRHKYEPGMEESRQDEISFAQELSQFLEDEILKGHFDELMLIAAPQMLGLVRKSLGKNTQAALGFTADKNYGTMEEPELKAELLKLIPRPSRL